MRYLFPLLVIASCASKTQLTEKAKNLEVYATKPAAECRVMGRVVGQSEEGSKELALNHALNQAADLKATGVFVNQEVPNGARMAVHATAYQCD